MLYVTAAICRIEQLAAHAGQQVVYIWCAAPRETCWQRCAADYNSTHQRRQARLNFIEEADESFFMPIPGEAVENVLPVQQRPRYILGGAYYVR